MRTAKFLIAIFFGIASTCLAQEPTWTQKCGTNGPQAGYYAAMAYDSAHGQSVLFGGDFSDFSPSNETWTWDGSIWMKQNPANSPPGRCCFGMAYDAARGQVVIFGGANASGFLNDTWVWDGVNWTQKASGPGPTLLMGLAYDAARQQVVFFGGGVFPNQLAETWVWDGTTWTKESPATSPPPRSNFRLAYDAVHSETLLFGGSNGVTLLNDTWVWDGTTWTQKFPASSPTIRQDYGLAYDTNRQRVVLFSGIQPPNVPVDDLTWLWDGSNWTTASPAASPPARGGDAMAYDAARGQIVLFGGVDSSQIFTDTWVLGGPTPPTCQPAITSIFPTSGMQGDTIGNFKTNGSNFDPAAVVSFGGTGIIVNSYISRTPDQIVTSISIASASQPGTRDVIVMNSDQQHAAKSGAFTISLAPPQNAPDIGVSPVVLDFGTVPVHSSVTNGVSIQNTGTASLSVTNITSTDSSFTVSPTAFALDPGHGFIVSVTFSPLTAGTASGVLKIASNASASAIFVSMTGVGGAAQVGRITLVSSNDTSPNHPLFISSSNARRTGKKVVADVTITNVTGAWYELDLNSSSPSPGPPFPIPVKGFPFAFLIGPFQQATFKNIEFTNGEYLQFDASTTSISASAMFGIDMIVRTIFGVELNLVTGILDTSQGVVAELLIAVGKNCTGAGVAFNFSTATDAWSLIGDAAQFMGCTVSNQQVRQAISQLLPQLYSNQIATQWIQIGAGTIEGVLFAFTHVTKVVSLADQELSANPHGFVRLEARRP